VGVGGALPLAILLFASFLLFSPASAGYLKGHQRAVAADYFDFRYAEYVWNEMTTLAELDEEIARYAEEFDPWAERYDQNPTKAMHEIQGSKPESALQRGYDAQLAFDEWMDHVYSNWYFGYKGGRIKISFDQWLSEANELRKSGCKSGRRNFLDSCGPLPDWRSEQNKADERAMMAEADRLHGKH
jgi:hypothetical protein